MSRELSDHEREVRDTLLKSTMTGVGVTALAVVAFSSAGFGGMIGTSMASGAAPLPAPESDPYVSLPAYPQPLSDSEINDILAQLASTSASLEITRAATEQNIERVRALALTDGVVSVSAPRSNLDHAMTSLGAGDDLRPRMDVASAAPASGELAAFEGGGLERDRHLEFAALLLGEDPIY